MPEQPPICPGCGQRHERSAKSLLDEALLNLAQTVGVFLDVDVADIGSDSPLYVDLKADYDKATEAAQAAVMEQLLGRLGAYGTPEPEPKKPSTGFYL